MVEGQHAVRSEEANALVVLELGEEDLGNVVRYLLLVGGVKDSITYQQQARFSRDRRWYGYRGRHPPHREAAWRSTACTDQEPGREPLLLP